MRALGAPHQGATAKVIQTRQARFYETELVSACGMPAAAVLDRSTQTDDAAEELTVADVVVAAGPAPVPISLTTRARGARRQRQTDSSLRRCCTRETVLCFSLRCGSFFLSFSGHIGPLKPPTQDRRRATTTTYSALALCTLPDMDNTHQKTKRSQTSPPEAVDVTGTEVACLSVTGATALLPTMTAF